MFSVNAKFKEILVFGESVISSKLYLRKARSSDFNLRYCTIF